MFNICQEFFLSHDYHIFWLLQKKNLYSKKLIFRNYDLTAIQQIAKIYREKRLLYVASRNYKIIQNFRYLCRD